MIRILKAASFLSLGPLRDILKNPPASCFEQPKLVWSRMSRLLAFAASVIAVVEISLMTTHTYSPPSMVGTWAISWRPFSVMSRLSISRFSLSSASNLVHSVFRSASAFGVKLSSSAINPMMDGSPDTVFRMALICRIQSQVCCSFLCETFRPGEFR